MFFTRKVSLFLCILATGGRMPLSGASTLDDHIKLKILHYNDVHARIEPADMNQRPCNRMKQNSGTDPKYECFGGMAKLAKIAKDFREESRTNTDTLYLILDAGDQFSGTLWNTHYKGDEIAPLLNMIQPDAFVFGNHEFDFGPGVLKKFTDKLHTAILSCNIDFTKAPEFGANFPPYKLFKTPGGKTVAVVGYTTPDTMFTSNPGKHISMAKEEDLLPLCLKNAFAQADATILLGHSGYERDKEFAAAEWAGKYNVMAVVGGHSHTLLGRKEDVLDDPAGEYPTWVTNQWSGKKIPVVQAFWASKYAGMITSLVYDVKNKEVVNFTGAPIILSDRKMKDNKPNPYYVEDLQAAVDVIEALRPQLQEFRSKVVGEIYCRLDGEKSQARLRETNLGSLVADAILWRAQQLNSAMPIVALYNSGGLRASIEGPSVTVENVMSVLPFGDQLTVVKTTEGKLFQILEDGLAKWSPPSATDPAPGFPQVAGFRFLFDGDAKPSHRVKEIKLEPKLPQVKVDGIKLSRSSKSPILVATNDFLAIGGDFYYTLGKEAIIHEGVEVVADAVINYLSEKSQQGPMRIECKNRSINVAIHQKVAGCSITCKHKFNAETNGTAGHSNVPEDDQFLKKAETNSVDRSRYAALAVFAYIAMFTYITLT